MAQKFGPLGPIFYTPTKVAPMSLQIKFQVKIEETFKENRRKPIYWPILALFGAKTARKVGQQGSLFTHTCEYPQFACKPGFMVPY